MPFLVRIGKLLVVVGFIVLLVTSAGGSSAQGVVTGQAISNVNIRTGPGETNEVVGVLPARSAVTVEGRDRVGRWVLVAAPDSGLRGWAASRYITWSEDIPLGSLPVLTDTALSTVPQTAPGAIAGGEANAWPANQMNLRAGPGTAFDTLGQLMPDTALVLEARTPDKVWALIHTPDGQMRGWVALDFLRISNSVNLDALPASNAPVNEAPPPAAAGPEPASPPEVIEQVAPASTVSEDTAAMMAVLNEQPIIPTINDRMREIYQFGQSLGNNSRRTAKVGDSNSERSEYLDGFAYGDYDLGPYTGLQPTIDYFGGGFADDGVAVRAGYTSWIVSDPRWNHPECPNMTLLECELVRVKPSVALVFFGPADIRFMNHHDFRDALHRIVAISTQRGVIPVLFTFPVREDARSGEWDKALRFNMEMINVARQHNIPLVNLWRAAYPLPDHGVHEDQIHLSNGSATMRFTGDEQQWGFPLWNLLALQTLDSLRQEIPMN